MGLFDFLKRSSSSQGTNNAKSGSADSSAKPLNLMNSYSVVKNENGAVVGLWFEDPQKAELPGFVETLLVKHGVSHLIGTHRRIVPNKIDNKGGCFVMFS